MKNSYISSFKRATRYRPRAVHVAVFVVLFLLAFGSMEYLNRTYNVVNNSYYNILKKFYPHEREVEILFLGDSQFEWDVNTDLFSHKTGNLSFGGINFIQSYYLLKHEIGNMPNLKVVVLPMDHHSFHPFKTDRFEIFFVDKYLDWWELMPIKGPKVLVKRFNYATVLDDGVGRKSFVEKTMRHILGRGKFSFMRVKTVGPTKAVALDRDLLLYFYKTLVLCKAYNIKVVTASMPITREYSIGAEKKLYRINDIERFIFGDSRYSDLIYRNFNHTAWNLDKTNLFKDGHHLNHEGRDAFTPILADELDTIMDQIPKTNMKSPNREDR